MIKISVDLVESNPEKVWKFPGGEVGVRLNEEMFQDEPMPLVHMAATLCDSDEIMELLMTVDALRRMESTAILHLFLPYIPYARQDRVCVPGESLSASVMAGLINSLGADTVMILDPHSDVTPALIKNSIVINSEEVFSDIKTPEEWANTVIVAPDAGAYKKAYKFAERVGAKDVITCSKIRNLSTGNIKELKCHDDVTGLNLMIVDDIGDGMGTFIGLADVFGNRPAKLELAVTHGLFTKGLGFLDRFSAVYTTNSCAEWESTSRLKVINIF